MSMENEGPDSTARFDAFQAQQPDGFEQQEQPTYTFPPEYAADPNAVFEQPVSAVPPPGDGGGRSRSLLIVAGAVLVVCVLGLGAWLALDSSGSTANAAATSVGAPAATATGTGKAAAKRALTFRVTIASVGPASFTGTAHADGGSVTVTLTAKTRFGTKAHAFGRAELTVGETVIVRGRRTGTDAITATEVAANVTASASAAS